MTFALSGAHVSQGCERKALPIQDPVGANRTGRRRKYIVRDDVAAVVGGKAGEAQRSPDG